MKFTAKEANQLYHEARDSGATFQRGLILDEIKRVANWGNNFYVLNYPTNAVGQEDIRYFENLGYRVINNTASTGSTGSNVPAFTMLTWDRV